MVVWSDAARVSMLLIAGAAKAAAPRLSVSAGGEAGKAGGVHGDLLVVVGRLGGAGLQ